MVDVEASAFGQSIELAAYELTGQTAGLHGLLQSLTKALNEHSMWTQKNWKFQKNMCVADFGQSLEQVDDAHELECWIGYRISTYISSTGVQVSQLLSVATNL